jgi:mannose-1-phosphate guanylyltransferase
MPNENLSVHAVILAGGRGTRFWPRSRTRTPKQLLNIVGNSTMLQQTVARLRSIVSPQHIWTVTNAEQAPQLAKQLPASAGKHILVEPIGRNTTAAIALAAIHMRHAAKGDAVLAVLPADHYIAKPERYRQIFRAAVAAAQKPHQIVTLGIVPTHPETGFGYIERAEDQQSAGEFPCFPVRRFTEKPQLSVAREYVASGKYFWNAGMFFWRVSTFLDALKEFLPETYNRIEELSTHIGKRPYPSRLAKIYPKLENISVDYAILEKAAGAHPHSNSQSPTVCVIPAEIGWSDIGSWAAVYDLSVKNPGENILTGEGHCLDSQGNFLWSSKKFIAAIGVHNLVVVETPDALLICPRDRAQDVSKLVKSLEERELKKLL